MASLFIGHAALKSKLHNLQYDEGGNHMAETERETIHVLWILKQIKFCSVLFEVF